MTATYPPRPSGSVLSHTIRYLKDPFTLITDAMKDCGEVFSLRLLGIGDWVVVCSSDTIREVYKAPSDVFVTGELIGEMVGSMFGVTTIGFLDGVPHRTRQRLMVPLLNGRSILRYIPTMCEATEEAITRFPSGEPFSLLPRIHHLALEVIVRAIFGHGDRSKTERLVNAYTIFTEKCVSSPLLAMPFMQFDLGRYSPWGRIVRLRAKVREVFRQEIESRQAHRRSDEAADDILTTLMNAEEDGAPLPEEVLLDEVFALLIAGHETTSTTLAWIIQQVLSCPEVQERLHAELDSVLGDRPIESSNLHDFEYLNAVIQEGHRISRRVPFTGLRRVKKPFEVGGYVIPEGKIVAVSHYAMCHRADTFPQPGRFDPGRFLRDEAKDVEFRPFGGGGRSCAGKGVAEVELAVVLATLFQRTRLELVGSGTKAVRHGFMFGPEHGLPVILKERVP